MPAARRIGVGFHGGQVLSLRVSEEQLKALQRALGGSGWHDVESDEGLVRLDLSQICYVRSETEDLRVGFRFRTHRRTIREADLAAFVALTGLTEELFTVKEEKQLVPGALVYIDAHRRPGDVVLVTLPSSFAFAYYRSGGRTEFLDDANVSMGFVTRLAGLRAVVYADGLTSDDTTRATPATMMASTQGGVLP